MVRHGPTTAAKLSFELGPVEETLLVPLWARARESREREPILRDGISHSIRDRLDFDFEQLDAAQASQVGCCVRAHLMDAWVADFLRRHPGGTVIELGCGLNGRFERVDDGRVKWIDLDLPAVVALRRHFFEDGPRRRTLATSALDPAWMDDLRPRSEGPWLFVTEGMLPYLQEAEVRGLFAALADRFPGAEMVFDAMTPLVLRHQRHHDAMRHFRARFTWALKHAADVESWDARIQLLESRRFFDLLARHPRRLPWTVRLFGSWLGALYPPFKRAYTINRARLG